MAAKVKERETLSVGLLCMERKARHDVHDIILTGTENMKGSEEREGERLSKRE